MADERITEGMKHQLGDLRRKLDRDERPLGYKLGFGTEAAMKNLGTDAPLVGHLVTANRLESGAVVDISNWGNPKLEPEIVARVGEQGEITAIGAAIELVDLAEAKLTVLVDGEEVATADDVTAATGDLDGLVEHVAKTLKAAGGELERGDMVICGSIVPALDITPGATVEVRLPPLGSLVVNFE